MKMEKTKLQEISNSEGEKPDLEGNLARGIGLVDAALMAIGNRQEFGSQDPCLNSISWTLSTALEVLRQAEKDMAVECERCKRVHGA